MVPNLLKMITAIFLILCRQVAGSKQPGNPTPPTPLRRSPRKDSQHEKGTSHVLDSHLWDCCILSSKSCDPNLDNYLSGDLF